jgi:hypothetical protein
MSLKPGGRGAGAEFSFQIVFRWPEGRVGEGDANGATHSPLVEPGVQISRVRLS